MIKIVALCGIGTQIRSVAFGSRSDDLTPSTVHNINSRLDNLTSSTDLDFNGRLDNLTPSTDLNINNRLIVSTTRDGSSNIAIIMPTRNKKNIRLDDIISEGSKAKLAVKNVCVCN